MRCRDGLFAVVALPRDDERFWSKVSIPADVLTGCWTWTASVASNGYGQIMIAKRPWPAHRVAWTLINGQPSRDLVIDHICNNRRCVNVTHLRQLTERENIQRPNVERTHCRYGHPRIPENMCAWDSARCRPCNLAWVARHPVLMVNGKRVRTRAGFASLPPVGEVQP